MNRRDGQCHNPVSAILSLIVCSAFAISGCDDEQNDAYLPTDHSDCLLYEAEGVKMSSLSAKEGSSLSSELAGELKTFPEPSVQWAYDAKTETLTVEQYAFVFNCCPSGIRSWAEVQVDVIELHTEDYSDNDEWCDCECPYNVTSHIPDIGPGQYTLEVYAGRSAETPIFVEKILLLSD